MTTKVFPTPAALREMREAAAAQEIDAAAEACTAEIRALPIVEAP